MKDVLIHKTKTAEEEHPEGDVDRSSRDAAGRPTGRRRHATVRRRTPTARRVGEGRQGPEGLLHVSSRLSGT